MMPVISIITVGMNHLPYIKELYRSLYTGDSKPKMPFEAIYIDNCSKDGSVEFLNENYPQVKIIQNETRGQSGRAALLLLPGYGCRGNPL